MMHYSIIRLIADPVRDERINVGVVGIYGGKLIVRVPSVPTRAMLAMLSQDQVEAVAELQESITAAFERRQRIFNESGEAFLDDLWREGLNGFLLSQPQERLITEPTTASAQNALNGVFERVVLPLPVLLPKKPAQSRIRSMADNIIRRYLSRERTVVRNVSVQIRPIEPALDFAFAYANGRLVLGQAVDLDVRAGTQRKNSDHALANFSDFERRVARPHKISVEALHVVRVGPKTDDYASSVIERLQSTGDVLRLPEQRKELEHIIQREAQHNVEHRFRELGFRTEYDENSFEATYQSDDPLPTPASDLTLGL